jgi:hypothetical protein
MILISVALQPKSGLGRLFVEVSRSYIDTHTHPVGLLWTSDQLFAEAATYTTNNKHKRRTSMLSAGFEPAIPAVGRRLIPHGHRHWRINTIILLNHTKVIQHNISKYHYQLIRKTGLNTFNLISLCIFPSLIYVSIYYGRITRRRADDIVAALLPITPPALLH